MLILVYGTAALLSLFTIRRYVFWLASCFPALPNHRTDQPSVMVIIAAHNEEAKLTRCLASLSVLEYPPERLQFVIASDGSTDRTAQIAREWANGRTGASVIELKSRLGKGGALQAALDVAAEASLIVSADADSVLDPVSLQWLAGAFDDPRVGLATAYAAAGNPSASWIARYAALERWVYHLIVLAGKDRLRANPPSVGVLCAYRRSALQSCGGFPADQLAEDVALSVRLTRAGWRTRWIREAIATEDVASTLSAFWNQRQRWSRGLAATSGQSSGLEGWLVAAGYADRAVFLAALALAASGRLSILWLGAYAAAPLVSLVTAVAKSGERNKLPYLLALPLFAVDVASAVSAILSRMMGRSVPWRPRE